MKMKYVFRKTTTKKPMYRVTAHSRAQAIFMVRARLEEAKEGYDREFFAGTGRR